MARKPERPRTTFCAHHRRWKPASKRGGCNVFRFAKQTTVFSRRGKLATERVNTSEVWNPPAKSFGRFRSDREKTRKAEISKDFSAFFDSNFFRISIDPFSVFHRAERNDLWICRFLQKYSQKQAIGRT